MSWNTLRTWEAETDDDDWVGTGTVPPVGICGNVGGRSTIVFDAVWLDGEDGDIVAGAGEVTLQPILVVDGPERASAGEAQVAAAAGELYVVADVVGRFTLHCSAATPPEGGTHLRISWAVR
jgi:hypothetical protein